jgi:tRNA-Thr(GGU) m(6)t(6)A37 methyltransferase TsaA
MLKPVTLSPIGVVRSPVNEVMDDVFGDIISRIEVDCSRFTPDSLLGLSDFSHVEIVFIFDRMLESEIEYGARHPRGRTDWPMVGILAQRGKNRPNRIGVTICQLVSVRGLTLEVKGLDAIEGTPVLDIKPYMPEFAPRGEVRHPAWAAELMSGYWHKSK